MDSHGLLHGVHGSTGALSTVGIQTDEQLNVGDNGRYVGDTHRMIATDKAGVIIAVAVAAGHVKEHAKNLLTAWMEEFYEPLLALGRPMEIMVVGKRGEHLIGLTVDESQYECMMETAAGYHIVLMDGPRDAIRGGVEP